MPNQITPSGLETASQAELVSDFTAAFETIYGADINLDSDSPDGQMMMIFIQATLDVLSLLTQVYSSFDPDLAIGRVLDQRVAFNGIQRQAGTHTITNITIVTSEALNLFGLDQAEQSVYTVSDNAGTEWQLQATQNIPAAGTYVFSFQAKNAGAVLSVPNTITVPVTIVLGVSSINNPTSYSTLGINEESDAALKIRRQKSVSLASQGYLAGLLAALENINGVSSAFVYENTTASPDLDGVPGHSIWVIVAGTAPAADIAQAIYTKRNAGCGMFGATSFIVTQPDGSPFIVLWDVVEAETLFIKFNASSIDGINPPNLAAIRSQLVSLFVPGVNEEVNINRLATIVQTIDPNCLVTSAGFGLASAGPFSNLLSPSAKNKQFAISAPDIIILPMILSPTVVTVPHNGSKQFTGLGGFGTLTYSFLTNNSGGSINSVTGLYTAGATPSVVDTLKVQDSLGNTANATVTVS